MIIFKILGFFICFDIFLVIIIKFWQKIQVFLFMCKNCKHYKKIFINGLQVDMFGDIPEVALTCFEDIPKKLIYSYSRHNFNKSKQNSNRINFCKREVPYFYK